MNCKGILRKTPSAVVTKRNISTHLVNGRQRIDNVQLIDHNHLSNSGDSFETDNKYQSSRINTTQKKKDRLEQLRNLTVKDQTLAELSPRSKGVVAEKVRLSLSLSPSLP